MLPQVLQGQGADPPAGGGGDLYLPPGRRHQKTQKRANALQNIVIPGLDGTIRFITDALEEKEREEFARLKVIKRVTTKQK